jgi:GNAT superfamily N-acetyltransferase
MQAKPEELDIFIDILERAAQWMEANKLNQWIPGSFVAPKTRAHIDHTISIGNAYFILVKRPNAATQASLSSSTGSSTTAVTASQDSAIIGTFTLNYTDPFDEMLWKDLVDDWTDAVYLHRLVVEREYKGYGLGPKALIFGEQEGLKRGKHYLRLDCMADNKLLKAYYREKAHFKEFEDYPGERLYGRFERPITATLP